MQTIEEIEISNLLFLLKRLRRGYRDFEHFRTRFLYATRDTSVTNGINDYNLVTYFDMED